MQEACHRHKGCIVVYESLDVRYSSCPMCNLVQDLQHERQVKKDLEEVLDSKDNEIQNLEDVIKCQEDKIESLKSDL